MPSDRTYAHNGITTVALSTDRDSILLASLRRSID
jgi:hypothetical protein